MNAESLPPIEPLYSSPYPTAEDVEQVWRAMSHQQLRDYARALQAENERLRNHILDIDAHATPFGVERDDKTGDEFITRYLVTAGCLHRALGTIGHSAALCKDTPDHDALQAHVALLEGAVREIVRADVAFATAYQVPVAIAGNPVEKLGELRNAIRRADAALSRSDAG